MVPEKVLWAFTKPLENPFEAPQRRLKLKNWLIFILMQLSEMQEAGIINTQW